MANGNDSTAAGSGAENGQSAGDGTLGRIALKRVRVSRAEAEARGVGGPKKKKAAGNPMNRLVPYLDLFGRLGNDELSRLARVPTSVVEGLRQQVDQVNEALARYVDLLPRLNDGELVRLTGANPKTIRFWRLSQASNGTKPARATPASVRPAQAAQQPSGVPEARSPTPTPTPASTETSSVGPSPVPPSRTTQPAPIAAEPTPVPSDSGSFPPGAVAAAISTQSSASMLMEEVAGEPFPGFEAASAPRGQDPVMEDIEIGMFEDDDEEEDDALDGDISLSDEGDFF